MFYIHDFGPIVIKGKALQTTKKYFLYILLVSTALLFTACGDGETSYSLEDLQKAVEKEKNSVDVKTSLGHLKDKYAVDMAESTVVIDEDLSDNIVYTVESDKFELVDGVLYVKADASVSYGTYEVIVTATDALGEKTQKKITIVVVPDINLLAPSIITSVVNILENTTGEKQIVVEALGKGKVHSFVFTGGVDDGNFTVTKDGLLSLKSSIDYEDPNAQKTFSIQLQAVDDLNNASTVQSITVNIIDVDEAYHFTSQSNFTVLDNHSVVGKVLALANDASMPDAEYSFTTPTTEFGIGLTSGELRFANAPVYHEDGTNNTFTVNITAKNAFNGSETQSGVITIEVVPDYTLMKPIIDGYETPVTTIPTVSDIVHVRAHSQAPDGNVTFALSGEDAQLFEVDVNGNVRFKSVEDFYNPRDVDGDNSFHFVVEVTEDYGNMEPTQLITVNLKEDPAKMKPVITTDTIEIVENSLGLEKIDFETLGTGVVSEYIIVNTSQSLTFNSPFKFEDGFVSFKSLKPDFETEPTYEVSLQVRDDLGNLSAVKTVAVNIKNVDEKYTFTSNTSFAPTEGETVVGTITTTPKKAIADANVIYSIKSQSVNKFKIDAQTGVLSFITASNFNDTLQDYSVTINVSSQYNGSLTESDPIIVRVLPLTRAITFDPQDIAVLPDTIGTVSVNIVATSADPSATITYAMQSGNDDSIFSIDSGSGKLDITVPAYKWSSDPDDNVYRGAVVASDQYGNSKVQQGEMHVTTSVNGKPYFTSGDFTIAENGTAVGTVVATSDIPSHPTLTYSIIGGADSGLFTISSSGVLSFINIANYEYKSTYSLKIQVTDNIGHPDSVTTQDITVNVTDVADAPTSISFDTGLTTTASDGYRKGFIIYAYYSTVSYRQLAATPSPSNGTLHYSIVTNPNASIFSISDSGNLKIDAPYHSGGDYDLTVQVSEDNGEVSNQVLRVTIIND